MRRMAMARYMAVDSPVKADVDDAGSGTPAELMQMRRRIIICNKRTAPNHHHRGRLNAVVLDFTDDAGCHAMTRLPASWRHS